VRHNNGRKSCGANEDTENSVRFLGHSEPARTNQRTIHWMPIITQLWMNLN
jgi:hypothetical protein